MHQNSVDAWWRFISLEKTAGISSVTQFRRRPYVITKFRRQDGDQIYAFVCNLKGDAKKRSILGIWRGSDSSSSASNRLFEDPQNSSCWFLNCLTLVRYFRVFFSSTSTLWLLSKHSIRRNSSSIERKIWNGTKSMEYVLVAVLQLCRDRRRQKQRSVRGFWANKVLPWWLFLNRVLVCLVFFSTLFFSVQFTLWWSGCKSSVRIIQIFNTQKQSTWRTALYRVYRTRICK